MHSGQSTESSPAQLLPMPFISFRRAFAECNTKTSLSSRNVRKSHAHTIPVSHTRKALDAAARNKPNATNTRTHTLRWMAHVSETVSHCVVIRTGCVCMWRWVCCGWAQWTLCAYTTYTRTTMLWGSSAAVDREVCVEMGVCCVFVCMVGCVCVCVEWMYRC